MAVWPGLLLSEEEEKKEPLVPVEEKPEMRPVETLTPELPKKKVLKKKAVKKKNAMPVVGLHSSGDPSVRLKEKPTIEELVKKEEK